MLTITQIVIIAVAILNIISFILVFADKRKSMSDSERLPEITFFISAIFFSALGVLAGMFVFRHKTQKLTFVIGIGLLLLQQIALVYLLVDKLSK